MELYNLVKDDEYDYSFTCEVWGQEDISISFDLPYIDDSEDKLEVNQVISDIKERLEWLDNNRALVEQALLDDDIDILGLADDWADDGSELYDENQKRYVMIDEQKVYLPIQEQTFLRSLYFNSIGIDYDEEAEGWELEIFIDCMPDYFAGHSIQMNIEVDGTISCNGLAG